MNAIDSIMGETCRRFARQVASGMPPLDGGLYRRFQFWVHWSICPFCRHYWKEIRVINRLHRSMSALSQHPAVKLPQIKRRITEAILKRYV